MKPQCTCQYTYPDLVERLYNLKHLAVPPEQGEKSGCFSSYDRRSVFNEQTGFYENWCANNDGDGYIRREGESIVALELDGPGVIWRVWSAFPGEGHIRIYIDGGSRPVIDKPFRDFFETFGDERCPANFPSLLPTLSRGRNSYVPIPFQRHCKVLLDKDWGSYYHITYSLFPDQSAVPSFDGSFDRESAIALAAADRILYRRGQSPYPKTEKTMLDFGNVPVFPGKCTVLADLRGSGVITLLKIKVDGIEHEPQEDQMRILRELTLSIKWDDEENPSVWSPLGDFFGSVPGLNEYRSLPLGVNAAGFYSFWYMPYSEGARIEMENDGDQAQKISYEMEYVPVAKAETEGLLRFHAKWHRGNYMYLERERFAEGGDRWPDWPLLLAEGRGRFCGVHLHVYNAWKKPTNKAETWWYGRWDRKSIDWWWGEGDEKFLVDGELFPSSFGTGSEDYIGYAWAAEPPFPMFDSAFACQPFIELDANGHTSVSRFHIADNIPFSSSFEGFIEKYKADVWEQANKCLYAATVYWYQLPGTVDRYEKIPIRERNGMYTL